MVLAERAHVAPAAVRGQPAMPELSQGDLDHSFDALGERWLRLKGRRVFLTGGTGFVGKWLLASLLEADRRLDLGCQVTVLTRNPALFRDQAPRLAGAKPVRLVAGDVRQLADAPGSRFDMVVHAATDAVVTGRPLDVFDTCVDGTRRVLDLAVAAAAEEVLIVSSGAVYGRQPTDLLAVDESYSGAPSVLSVDSAYAQGKRAAEWLGGAYAAEHGIRVKTARCFAFVGPYLPFDRHFAVGNFLGAALDGSPIVIHGDGTPLRSYLHASDMAAWLWAVLFDGRSQQAYNIGGTQPVSMRELAQKVVRAARSSSPIEVRRTPPAGAAAERYLPDTRRIRTELQLPAAWDLDEAIARTVDWHRRPAP